MSLAVARLRSKFPSGPGLWLLGVACVVMGWLLVPALGAGPLALDEHVSYWMLDSQQPGTVRSRCLEYGAVPPLGSWLQAASLFLFGQSEWALRLPSLVAAWLSLVVVYQTARQLGEPSPAGGSLWGGVAACLLACHPDVLDEVRIGRSYGLVVLLSGILILLTQRWRKDMTSPGRAIVWAVSAAALLWTHYTSAILVMMTWGFLAWEAVRSSPRGPAFRILTIATSLFVGLCLPLWPAGERLREWSPYLNMLAPESSVWQTISSFWWLGLPVGGLVASLVHGMTPKSTGGVSARGHWHSKAGWLLLGCSLVPLVMIAVLAKGDLSSLANPRYRVAYAPAGALWVAWLLTRSGAWKPAVLGVVMALAAVWYVQPLRPWQLGRLGSPADHQWRELSVLIGQQGQPDEPIFVNCGLVESSLVPAYHTDPTFMEYVACRVSKFYLPVPHPRIALPYFWDDRTKQFYQNELKAQSTHVLWIASATDTDLSRGSLAGFQQIAEGSGFRVEGQTTWPAVTLLRMTR